MPEPPIAYRVAEKRRETGDTWTLRLVPADGAAIARCAPGQFAMLYAFGVGEAPISISRIGADDAVVHTVRAVGAVTNAICAAQPGEVLGLRGPFGTVWPLTEADGRDVVIIAGGIGLAPLRPVIHELLAHRDRYGAVSVLYGGRSPANLLYMSELEAWRGRFDVDVDVIVDVGDADWRGRVGVVTRLIPRAVFDPQSAVAMVCGPEVMMRLTALALEDCGMSRDRIWLSLERGMTCATGHCGHCQLGPLFICKDGPVLRRDVVEPLMRVAEL
ncbi:MAG TPA: FAD/NAD(P)-binding protein [Solirubrobacteraceae bacterium]